MTRGRRRAIALVVVVLGAGVSAWRGSGRPSPLKLAPGWRIELVAEAPAIVHPTAIVAAPDGTIYLGQDPMDMAGPPTEPIDSIVAIRDGRVRLFADGLHAVMGLEWIDDALYVVHAPYLSVLRDTDGDGRADRREDIVTGLGPPVPAFNGINDHLASGMRLGMDGYLYIAVGDKGIPRAVGSDGTVLRMRGGGVIRVRPDGIGLEVVSTGERNPLSVAIGETDEVFTFGNDDDSKRWPNSLTHHVVGGHYGYPYEFVSAPGRCLPILGGEIGGAGAQGLCYEESGLGEAYRGNLFFCDWGRGAVVRYRLERAGGGFRIAEKEYIVRRGTLRDFRPFSMAVGDGGRSLYLTDWAFNGFLVSGPRAGRLYRLTREDAVSSAAGAANTADLLDDPSRSVRLAAQRALVRMGTRSEATLLERLSRDDGGRGRWHALWALSALDTPDARKAIRAAMTDADADVRAQAVRSAGQRRERDALRGLVARLGDASPLVRREAAIAIGRLGDTAAAPALLAAIGDADAVADWSIRHAIRRLGVVDVPTLRAALGDGRRRESALKLCDGTYSVPVVEALSLAIDDSQEPAWRARLVATLAGLHRAEPEWTGRWWGPNPLAGPPPRRTRDWDSSGQKAIVRALISRRDDPAVAVRREAIVGLVAAGETDALRPVLDRESDAANLSLAIRALGNRRDAATLPGLLRLLRDTGRSAEVREAAFAALSPWALKGDGLLPWIDDPAPAIRAAAIRGIAAQETASPAARAAIVARLDETSPDVRAAAIEVAGRLRIRDAVPGLLRGADAADSRLGAIRSLATIAEPCAAMVFLAAIADRDPEVRLDGERGLAAIRDRARDELETCRRSGRFSGYAALLLDRALRPFVAVRQWQVVGPFPRNAPRPFETIDFTQTLAGVEGRPIRWAARRGEADSGRVVLDDLAGGGRSGYDPGQSADLSAFACAEVVSPTDRRAWLRVGSSGTITVSVNGRDVLHADHSAGRVYAPDSDVVSVDLRAGTNRLLVRSRQGIGRWSFGVQVSDGPVDEGPFSPDQPPDDRTFAAYAMSHAGDARRGESLFFDPRGAGCWRCHSAGGRGSATIGPDLTGLAQQYDRREIIRSVLEPSSRIVNGYRPAVVAMDDGSVASGLLRAETDDALELIDASLRPTRLLKARIVERRLGEASPMPTGLVAGLSPREFADLIAFLEGLKGKPQQPLR